MTRARRRKLVRESSKALIFRHPRTGKIFDPNRVQREEKRQREIDENSERIREGVLRASDRSLFARRILGK